MINKYLIIFIGLFASLSSLYSSVKVTGIIKSVDKENVPFANVALMQDDHLITGTVSDDQGYFEFTIDTQDSYMLSISHILYIPKKVALEVDNQDLDLGTIVIMENNKMLEDINVIAQDVIHKADRDIVVLSDKYTKQAPNTEQVLQRLPSVSMDIVSRSFKVANRKNVLIQVDGVVKNEQYIRSLPPSKIKKVEIIRDVSGRYANEYDAILNVITDKSLRGYSVSGEDFTIATFDDDNNDILLNTVSLNYSYFTSKANIYGGYVNNYNRFKVPVVKEYNYDDDYRVMQRSKAADNLYSSSVNDVFLGADFTLAPNKILSTELRYSFSPYENNKQKKKQEFTTYNSDILLNQYEQNNSMQAKNNNPYALISYQGNIGSKNKINAGISYYQNDNQYSNIVHVDNKYRTEDGHDTKDYVDLYIEDNMTLNNSLNIDVNYNYKYQDINTRYEINNADIPENSNTLKRHNAGIYLNYSINDHSNLKVGSAIENVLLENKYSNFSNSDDQFVILPSLSYNNQVSEVLDIRLNYKVNTTNPSMSELSPYTSLIDSFSTITGNSLLKPSYYHEIKGALDLAGGGIVLQPFYKFGNDVQSKIGTLTDNHIVEYTYDNALKYEKYGFDFMGSIFNDFENKDQLYLSFEVQRFWEKAQYENNEHKINDWEISSQFAYLSNKYDAIFAVVLQKSNVRNITAQGYTNNTNDFLALALKKGLFNSKVELGCTYITPFSKPFTTYIGSTNSGNGFSVSDKNDVSVIQNSFIFQLVFNLDANKDKQRNKITKKKIDKDKIRTGLM